MGFKRGQHVEIYRRSDDDCWENFMDAYIGKHGIITDPDTVINVTLAITSNLNLNEVFTLIARKIPEVIGVDAATIRLLDTSGKKLELRAASGLSKTYLERGPLDDELSTYYILKGEPVMIPDATVDLHTIYRKEAATEGVGSVLAVPITVKDETIGMIRLLTSEIRYFSPADINFAVAVAEQGGIAIQNSINYQPEAVKQ